MAADVIRRGMQWNKARALPAFREYEVLNSLSVNYLLNYPTNMHKILQLKLSIKFFAIVP